MVKHQISRMVITNQLKNQHLSWRAGFGPMAEDIDQLRSMNPQTYFKALVKASSGQPQYIDVADNMLKGFFMGVDDITKLQKKDLSDDQKKQLRKQSQKDIKSLNLSWINEMVNGKAQLREKMSLFWHGHFASRNLNIFYQQLLLDTIRRNALGNFGDLLREVSKSAAMINFLNNNQNNKNHPNENFAREVMELFTMGRGNYTEQDVKEAARAFTGWGANLQGEFVFRRFQHDDGMKTVLGKTGRLDGDDVLNILLQQQQTAVFITRKMYRFFVNDTADEKRVAWLAARFYHNNYDILSLAEDIFTSDWFYEEKNIGSHIKSPVELLVGIRRILPMQIENEEVQVLVQRLLGQLLFYPPNVAGWQGGTAWIDSSTLMFRLRIPGLIYESDEFQVNPKDDDDQMMGMKDREEMRTGKRWNGSGNIINARINWDEYLKKWEGISRDQLEGELARTLLQSAGGPGIGLLNQYAESSTRDSYIKSITIRLMSSPEYQLS